MKILIGFWDRLGIGLSGLCAIHCLLLPVSFSFIPVWNSFFEFHEYTHLLFFIAIAPTAVFALLRSNKSIEVMLFIITGLLIIGLAWFFGDKTGILLEALITLIGSSFLITGHWKNYKLKKRCVV